MGSQHSAPHAPIILQEVIMRLASAVTLFAAFTAYTLLVAAQHGALGFLAVPAAGGWSLQVTLDLVFALSAFLTLAAADARKHGIALWPYIPATLILGSVGMLAYFVHRELRAFRAPATRP